jgi:hypothetical protein
MSVAIAYGLTGDIPVTLASTSQPVAQDCRCPRFSHKTTTSGVVADETGVNDLESHQTLETDIGALRQLSRTKTNAALSPGSRRSADAYHPQHQHASGGMGTARPLTSSGGVAGKCNSESDQQFEKQLLRSIGSAPAQVSSLCEHHYLAAVS